MRRVQRSKVSDVAVSFSRIVTEGDVDEDAMFWDATAVVTGEDMLFNGDAACVIRNLLLAMSGYPIGNG